MKTVTALLIAIAMTCAVAAQVNGATQEERAQALASPFVAENGVIRVHSQVGDVSSRVIERWSRNWRAIKRGFEHWTGVQVPNFPPEPTSIYLLTPANMSIVFSERCRSACGRGGRQGAYAAGYGDSQYDSRSLEVRLAQDGAVPHEMLHGVFEWVYLPDQARFGNDVEWRSPYLVALAREAAVRLNAEMGADPAPGTLKPERYERLKVIVKSKLGLAPSENPVTLWTLERARGRYNDYHIRGADGDEGVASQLFSHLLWSFNDHSWGNVWPTLVFERISNYFWREADLECQADGAC